MRKTIKAKISGATNGSKLDILDRELQRWDDILGDLKKMRHHDYPISEKQSEYNLVKTGKRHSAYCAYATFMIDSLDHPLPLHNDRFNVERRDTEVAAYWISVPTLERHGGVWLPLELPYQYYGFEDEWDIGDSYITKQDGKYYVHLKIEKEVDTRDEYDGVLGIDLGVRHVAVTWNTVKEKPRFYGRDLREIRGKYHYLRRKLQRQGDDGAVENLGKREKWKIRDALHNISREIVDRADEQDLAIVIGDLSDHRDSNFGRKGNRKLHSAPTYKLKQQIKYKAKEAGIACEIVDESYTTVTCSECGHERDSRPGKQFACPQCGYEINADVNGAKNIAERGLRYMRESGALVISPNPGTDTINAV